MIYTYVSKKGHKIISRRVPAWVKTVMLAVAPHLPDDDQFEVEIIARDRYIAEGVRWAQIGQCRYPTHLKVKIYVSLADKRDDPAEIFAHEMGHALHFFLDLPDFRKSSEASKEATADRWAKKLLKKKKLQHPFKAKFYKETT